MSTDSQLQTELPAGSRVKVIGLGGIGCIVLHYLSLFLNSLRLPLRLVLIDGDEFEPDNAARMQFSAVGNKAEVKAVETAQQLQASEIQIVPVPEYVTAKNIERLIRDGDIVFLCVDNHPTRKLVSDHCERLDNSVLISGGNDGVDLAAGQRGTYGNVQIAVRQDSQEIAVPLTRYHEEIKSPEGKMPGNVDDIDCGQMAISTPQVLFANLAVASWMLNAFYALSCGQLGYQELCLDIVDGRTLPQLPLRGGKAGLVQSN